MKRSLPVAVVASLVLLLVAPALSWPAWEAPWAWPIPRHALMNGYATFRLWLPTPAIPAWNEAWFDRHPPDASGPLLIDELHTSKQPWNTVLAMDAYSYADQHGFGRAFAPVLAAGVRAQEVRLPWNPVTLGGAAAVFLNLVSGENPPITWAEANALEAFVRRGGGLVLITEHTDCYFHGEVLAPLTGLLGLTLPPVTACDVPGHTLSPASRAWIRVATRPHAITNDVAILGLTTAGVIRAPSSWSTVAATSSAGWSDTWDPWHNGASAGFTGDLAQSPDEPSEVLPVVVAGEHGAGRVVVLGDQNAWGATLIGFEDNAQLFTNAFAWVLRRDIPVEVRGPRSVSTLVSPERPDCAMAREDGFRTLQVHMERLAQATGIPAFCTSRRAPASRSLVLLPGPARDDLDALFVPGRHILALLDDSPLAEQVRGHADGGATVVRVDAGSFRNAALGGERDDPRGTAREAAYNEVMRALDPLFEALKEGP